MKSYITSIGIANPQYCIPQMQVSEFMAYSMNADEQERRKLMAVFRSSGIKQRYSVLADYAASPENFTLFPMDPVNGNFPDINERMRLYEQEALPLSIKAINNCLKDLPPETTKEITHLITVSCTGMYAPGIDIELTNHFNFNTSIQRTSIQFMGCYAAFNALKIADSICKSNPVAKVIIVCTELCTLHFQKEITEDNLIANALFGDGSAAVLVEPNANGKINLCLENFYCCIAPEARDQMSWKIGNYGFEMILSSKVPETIKNAISNLSNKLLQEYSASPNEIDHFAIHPGGKRILDVIEQMLQIPERKNTAAREVLSQYGNMSSATVLFVLHELIMKMNPEDKGKKILSFAFGPGLTLEGMLIHVVAGRTKRPVRINKEKERTLDKNFDSL